MIGSEGNVTDEPVRILYVDDDPDVADMTARMLERIGEGFEVETATDVRKGEATLGAGNFDCVVSDYDMPFLNGIEFLEAVRADDPDLPFILFTGKGSEEVASEAISAGVTDYLQKRGGTGQYTVLANIIDNAVEARRSARRAERRRRRLEQFMRTVPACVLQIAEDGTILAANALAEEMFGLSDAPLAECRYNTGDWTVTDPEGRPIAAEDRPFRRVWQTEQPVRDVRLVIDVADGTRTVFSVNGAPLVDEEGRIESTIFMLSDITDLVERERDLERTKHLLDATERLADVGGWEVDVAQGPPYDGLQTDGLYHLHGLSPDESLPIKRGMDYVHPEDRERVESHVYRLIEEGVPFETEGRLVTEDGEVRWIHAVGTPVVDDGEVVKYRGAMVDISERKEREGKLRRRRDRLDALFQNLPNPVLHAVSRDGKNIIRDVNPAFVETFGYEPTGEELKRLYDLILPDDERAEERTESLMARVRRDGKATAELRRKTVDGVRDFRIDIAADAKGRGSLEGYAIYTDITTRKERERQRERRYEAIFNHSYQFTGLLEPDGTVLEVNRAALESVGADPEDVVGEPFWETPWWQVDEETPRKLHRAIRRAADGEFVRFETRHPTTDGEIVVDFSIRPVTDESGEVIYLLPEGRNITELKTLKQRERALERQNERLDQFASVLSHDLRSPLNVAIAHLALAREECESEELDKVERAQERMETLIQEVLTLARDGRTVASADAIDLAEVFEQVGYDMETGGATLMADADRDIRADRNRLHRLFENLIRNAIEHGGGDVTVRLGELPDGFYVEDDGRGIPEEKRDRIFEAGYSTSPDGTGFGLSIVREIAEAHDWDVRVTESDAGGARFEFSGLEDRE